LDSDERSYTAAMVVMGVLNDLGRILHCKCPQIAPGSIRHLAFSVNGSE
jgi:hypothetical protein